MAFQNKLAVGALIAASFVSLLAAQPARYEEYPPQAYPRSDGRYDPPQQYPNTDQRRPQPPVRNYSPPQRPTSDGSRFTSDRREPPQEQAAPPRPPQVPPYDRQPPRQPSWNGPPADVRARYPLDDLRQPLPDGSPQQGPRDPRDPRVPAGYDNPEARYEYRAPAFDRPTYSRGPGAPYQPQQPPQPREEVFEAGRVIAVVGSQYILAGDLLGDVNQVAAPYKDKLPPEEFRNQKIQVMQAMLARRIETKIMFEEFMKNVPAENVSMLERRLGEQFDKTQLVSLVEKSNANNQSELEAKLRNMGTSIAKQRRAFMEQVISREVIRQNVNYEPEVTHQEMLDYYRANLDKYDRPAKARWEELAVLFENHASKREAYKAAAALGNRVLRGAAFSRVAREQSEGFTSHDGGWHDWTSQDSLKSKVIDEALFTLPPNQLSRIIESDYGFHIIRVLDREEAGRTPFFKEQVRIKEILRKEKVKQQVQKYVAGVKTNAKVWTIFDEVEATESALRENVLPRG